MNIAFLHYHLKTGGVTTVLKQQLDAIGKKQKPLVLTGLPPETPFLADFVHIPELGYSSQYKKQIDPDDVAETIINAIRHQFNGLCDVLHVHNPTLAKNKRFLEILKSLQKRGVNLFLQIHDFAEDGRPFDYFADEYPADCHYGVINQRDYEILLAAGLKKEGLHRLVNTVNPCPIKPQPELEKPLVLYPIRAIRRKNIGEAILLSLFFRHGQTLAVTLPPNSPSDIMSYEGWKVFVRDRKLNLEFDKGLSHDFEPLVRSAEFLITTSITEGFGFTFLEPWIFEKLIWGRNLPDICRDFTKNGIRLEHLYGGLFVPVDWIGLHRFNQRWTACVLNAFKLFNLPTNKALILKALDSITKDGVIDFGLLNEAAQKEVIVRLISSRKAAKKLIQINPFLSDPGMVSDKNERINTNKRLVQECYNQTTNRPRMLNLYNKVISTPVIQKIDKIALATAFLNLEEFSLLKWGEYVE
jgi:glycosyltransferase involved in cell wall biosynthesis